MSLRTNIFLLKKKKATNFHILSLSHTFAITAHYIRKMKISSIGWGINLNTQKHVTAYFHHMTKMDVSMSPWYNWRYTDSYKNLYGQQLWLAHLLNASKSDSKQIHVISKRCGLYLSLMITSSGDSAGFKTIYFKTIKYFLTGHENYYTCKVSFTRGGGTLVIWCTTFLLETG